MTRKRSAILALFLTLPVVAFLVHHYTHYGGGLHPTGFTTDENVLYMSYAHQYLDQSHFSLCYSNPFDGFPQSPRIYFQPVNFLFAGLMKMGADPGFIFSIFGLLMAFACIYTGVRILQHLLPGNRHIVLISILFSWGGGLTALAGVGSYLSGQSAAGSLTDSIYLADPANGWWGMNWGRILFIPLEAFYHFLFLAAIYLLLKQKWKGVLSTAFLLSVSHPFTGIEFLLIICGWLGLEKMIWKNKSIPWWFAGGIAVIILFHVWYYLYYLNNFPEHKQLFSQYSAGWTYSFRVFVPAYLLVFGLACLTFFLQQKNKPWLRLSEQRLFICWAAIAFLLSKHEWFIRPMQPIHFTRGYVWAGLFLSGLPALIWLLERLKNGTGKKLLLIGLVALLLMDNGLWIGNHLRQKNTTEWEGYLSDDTRQLFKFLHAEAKAADMLVSKDRLVSYMANVYSAANSWVSHPYNTPNRPLRVLIMDRALEDGMIPAEWQNRRLLVVINKKDEPFTVHPSLARQKLFENNSYIVFTP